MKIAVQKPICAAGCQQFWYKYCHLLLRQFAISVLGAVL